MKRSLKNTLSRLVWGAVMLVAAGSVAFALDLEDIGPAAPATWNLPVRFEEPEPFDLVVSAPGAEAVKVDGQFAIAIPGQITASRPGVPDIPRVARVVRGLSGYIARIEEETGEYEVYEDVEIVPSETQRLVDMPEGARRYVRERTPDEDAYASDSFWPGKLFELREAWMGTQKMVRIECRLAQYDPQKKVLRIYSGARARIVFEPDLKDENP